MMYSKFSVPVAHRTLTGVVVGFTADVKPSQGQEDLDFSSSLRFA
jgi:hypothetical protein